MRVLWLAPVHFDAGADVHPAPWISTLAKSLTQDHGVALTILNYQPRLGEQEVKFEQDGIRYVFLKTPSPKWDHLGYFKKRTRIIRGYLALHREEYDMIHVHGSEHQYEAAVVGTGIPHVLSMQGVMGECLKRLKQRFTYTHLSWWMSSLYERFYVPQVKDFICRTHFDTGFVKGLNPTARIHENWEMIRPEFFQDIGSTTPDRLLSMGGTHPIKGVAYTLQAFNIIRGEVDIKLSILGKVDRAAIRKTIEKLELDNIKLGDIEYLGFQDVTGVVAAMDKSYALLHTTLIDNSPNSVCEAQVGGLPVVATHVGGVSSLIDNGRTGLLTSLDAQEIAEATLELIRNPELHSTLKRESRTMARQRHEPKLIAQRTMDIYREVMISQ